MIFDLSSQSLLSPFSGPDPDNIIEVINEYLSVTYLACLCTITDCVQHIVQLFLEARNQKFFAAIFFHRARHQQTDRDQNDRGSEKKK